MTQMRKFTGKNVWGELSCGADDSIFLHTWHALPEQNGETDLLDRWARFRAFRANVQKELETVRVAGGNGSSLQAAVTLHASPASRALLAPLGADQRFVLITSPARVIA